MKVRELLAYSKERDDIIEAIRAEIPDYAYDGPSETDTSAITRIIRIADILKGAS